VHPPIFHTHFLPASILVKFISKTLHLQRNFQSEIEGPEHTSVWPDVATAHTKLKPHHPTKSPQKSPTTTKTTTPPWTSRQHDMIPILNWHFDMDLTLKTLCWLYWCRLPCPLASFPHFPCIFRTAPGYFWGLLCVCGVEASRYPLDFCTNLRGLSARRDCVTWVLSLNTF